MNTRPILIVGYKGQTNIGESLLRASIALGFTVEFCDASQAEGKSVWLRRLSWHLAGHRPVQLHRFSNVVEAAAKRVHPEVLISTGLTPVTAKSLKRLKALGVTCLNYSTDDPFNPGRRARWFLRTLPVYDHIFTTRRSNIDDLRRIGAS